MSLSAPCVQKTESPCRCATTAPEDPGRANSAWRVPLVEIRKRVQLSFPRWAQVNPTERFFRSAE